VTRTTDDLSPRRPLTEPPDTIGRIIGELHETITAIRCASTGRLMKLGLSMTHMHVLWQLQHHGEMPMNRIADLLDVSLSNATGIIDRMEERGLVERVRVPDDRRLVHVRPTDKGHRTLGDVEAVKRERVRSVLDRLSPAQLDRVARAFDDIRAAVAAEGGGDLHHTHH
jgi:DNA-binding MarR family transcriptional regulator